MSTDRITEAAVKLGYKDVTQREIVEQFLSGSNVFASLPPAACYWILHALSNRGKCRSIVLVVVPLIALMKEQVHTLTTKGVSVCCTRQSIIMSKQNETSCPHYSSELFQFYCSTIYKRMYGPYSRELNPRLLGRTPRRKRIATLAECDR